MIPATFDYDAERDQWVLRCSPRSNDLAATIPALKYLRDAWRGPARLATALAARELFGEGLEVSDAAHRRAFLEIDENETAQGWLTRDPEEVRQIWGLDPRLFDFQVGSSGMMVSRWTLNNDDRGNGKTPQTLAAIEVFGQATLVVCTKSMAGTWAQEAAVWAPSFTVFELTGTKPQREKMIAEARECERPLLITTWKLVTTLSKHAHFGSVERRPEHVVPGPLNGGWIRYVAADEAHKMKDPKSQWTRAMWAIGDEAEQRVALTATPVTESPLDIWPILRFLDPPGHPSRSKWRDRYVLTSEDWWGKTIDLGFDPTHREEFDRTTGTHTVRRPLQVDVATLPPQVRWLDMHPKQRTAYKAMKKDMLAMIDGGIMVATDPMVRDTRLHQIAAATPVIDDDGNVTELIKPSCKVDALLELVEEMDGDPLVVFTESRKLADLCYASLTNFNGAHPKAPLSPERVGLITGKISGSERTMHKDNFQAGEYPVIVLTIGAGSEGLTLTRSNTVAFLQRSYKALANIQAEGRVLRIGQNRDVRFIEFITRGTVEEGLYQSVDGKYDKMVDFFKDEGAVRRLLADG